MRYTELTVKAMRFAYNAHKDQYDKGGVPYIFHPFHIAEQLEDETDICVALLHDVVEDTEYTFSDLKAYGFTPEIVDAVRCLTKEKGEEYTAYLQRVLKNDIAVKVKLLDIQHNSSPERLRSVKDADRLIKKYKQAKEIILKGTDNG